MPGENRGPAQEERKNLLFLLLLVPFGSLRDLDDARPHWEGKSLCSVYTDSNSVLVQRHLHSHTQK